VSDIREALSFLVPLVKSRYPDVDDDRLREICGEVLASAVGDQAVTANDLLARLDKRVNEELRT
jgi:hypothetical protein